MMQKAITVQEWRSLSGPDKEKVIFTILGVYADQFDQIIQEYIQESGKTPNAIFISWITLAKMPVRIKKIKGLQVIPMDAQEGQFVLSIQDPHDWGNLFYS